MPHLPEPYTLQYLSQNMKHYSQHTTLSTTYSIEIINYIHNMQHYSPFITAHNIIFTVLHHAVFSTTYHNTTYPPCENVFHHVDIFQHDTFSTHTTFSSQATFFTGSIIFLWMKIFSYTQRFPPYAKFIEEVTRRRRRGGGSGVGIP